MSTGLLSLRLVRSFSLGFTIHSPTQEGIAVDLYFGCFDLCLCSRGTHLVAFDNFWNFKIEEDNHAQSHQTIGS